MYVFTGKYFTTTFIERNVCLTDRNLFEVINQALRLAFTSDGIGVVIALMT